MKHDATEAEIKAAYKQAAKSAHPDAGGSNEKMQEVSSMGSSGKCSKACGI